MFKRVCQQLIQRYAKAFAQVARHMRELGAEKLDYRTFGIKLGLNLEAEPALRAGFEMNARRIAKGFIRRCYVQSIRPMRHSALFGTALALAATLTAGPKKVISPTTTGANETVDLEATITLTEDEVSQKLGVDPGKGIVLLQAKVTPKTDKPIQISPDDFILLAHDDGERSKPFEPAEIAGDGALVFQNGKTTVKKSSTTLGMGGMIGGGGSAQGPKTDAGTTKMDAKSQGNAKLLTALKTKQLPTKESTDPVEGYLYFPLDGKHKLKNLAVLYRGPAGNLNLEFQH